MSFTGTCHAADGRTHTEPITFDDGPAFVAHVKDCRPKLYRSGRYERPYQGKPMPSTRYRPFTPELGDIGSWVTMSDGTTGQVWSAIRGGKSAEVYVATGTEYRREHVRHLSPATDPAEQLTITPEPTPEPVTEAVAAPEPVLQAAIDSGHAVIVPVGFSEPTPEPVKPARMAPAERKAWNRAVADLARERDQYRAVMDAWEDVTELRLAGASPSDAVDTILGTVSNVTPIRGTA